MIEEPPLFCFSPVITKEASCFWGTDDIKYTTHTKNAGLPLLYDRVLQSGLPVFEKSLKSLKERMESLESEWSQVIPVRHGLALR